MAKADDTTTKIDWISLREARDLAAKALRSKAGAEEQLLEWMATGELPWTCTRWKAPTAADIAKMNQIQVVAPSPQTVYRKGNSRFMADGPDIDWEDNSACEASYLPDGAHAWGIMVSRARVLALLAAAGIAPVLPASVAGIKNQAQPQRTKTRKSPQVDRIVRALPELFPNGVSDEILTADVRKKAGDYLEHENKNKKLGLAYPSWDSVNRALGRNCK